MLIFRLGLFETIVTGFHQTYVVSGGGAKTCLPYGAGDRAPTVVRLFCRSVGLNHLVSLMKTILKSMLLYIFLLASFLGKHMLSVESTLFFGK